MRKVGISAQNQLLCFIRGGPNFSKPKSPAQSILPRQLSRSAEFTARRIGVGTKVTTRIGPCCDGTENRRGHQWTQTREKTGTAKSVSQTPGSDPIIKNPVGIGTVRRCGVAPSLCAGRADSSLFARASSGMHLPDQPGGIPLSSVTRHNLYQLGFLVENLLI
jgi:hypothetical protein